MQQKNPLVNKIHFYILFASIAFSLLLSCDSQPGKESVNNKNWEGKVMTVQGLIPADSMGITLTHEHLLITFSRPDMTFPSSMDLTDEATAISELKLFAAAGGKTLTEMTTIGLGRNPEGLKRISAVTGVNVIMGAGFYKQYWQSRSVVHKSINQLADIMIKDIIQGINGIHAGVIGEIGITKPITPFGGKLLKASALAQKTTGASVIVHFDIDEDVKARNYALDILEKNGADLTRVCVGHNTPYVDQVDNFVTYAKRGCYVAFDMLGLEVYKHDQDKYFSKRKLEIVETIKGLIDKGYLNNILLSQDIYVQACYVKNGGY